MKASRADAAPRGFAWPCWAAFCAAAAALPYFAARAAAPEGSRYLWILPPYAADSQAYLAWERQAQLGRILFKFKYTSVPHAPFVFQPFFLLVGRTAAWTGVDLGLVQLAFKTAGVLLFWVAFRRLARRLDLEREALWPAALLAGAGTGLGWLFRSAVPVDLWLIDANTFWSLTWNPLFPYVLALLVFFVDSAERARAPDGARAAWLAGGAAALLLLLHPYAAPILLLFALWVGWSAGPRILARIALPVLPVASYLAWAVHAHPIVGSHDRLGAMASPTWTAVLLGLAPPLALALGGWLAAERGFVRRYAPLFVWALGALILCRLPFWFQRKILFGVHVPLCLLGGAGAVEISRRWRGARLSAIGLAAGGVLLSLPTWNIIAGDAVLTLSERGESYFVPRPMMGALEFLRDRGTPDEAVFSSPETGGLVPAVAGKTAIWGHWAQSVDDAETRSWYGGLMAPGNAPVKARRLWAKTDYVLAVGVLKRRVDGGNLSWLKGEGTLLFSRPGVDVYGPLPR